MTIASNFAILLPAYPEIMEHMTNLYDASENLDLHVESSFFQRDEDRLVYKYAQSTRVLLSHGMIRKETKAYDADGALNYIDLQVFDGEKTVWYRASQKTATIDSGRYLNLAGAEVALMAKRIGSYHPSRFSLGATNMTFEDIVRNLTQAKPIAGGRHGARQVLDGADAGWQIFPAGVADGCEVFYATGLFQYGRVLKVWIDPTKKNLLARQEFFDGDGHLSAMYRVTDSAEGFPRSFELTQYTYLDGKPLASQMLKGSVTSITVPPSTTPSDFTIEVPDGVYVIDRVVDYTYTTGTQ